MAQTSARRDIEQELVRCLGSTLNQLSSIWDEIGIVPQMRQTRCKTVAEHMKTLLSDMVKEEEGLKRRLLENIVKYQTELANLCLDLQVTPHKVDDKLSILMTEKELRIRVDSLTKEKHERKRRQRALQQRDQALCDLMCSTPYYIPSGSIPTKDQLAELEAHINELEAEKVRRQGMYRNFKKNISKMLDELEESANTSFQRDVVADAEESFLLTNDNMKAIKHYHDDLEKRQQDNFTLATTLRERCHQLWERLQHPEEERAAFSAKHTGFKPSTINALKEEVGRCELMKLQNLQQVITRTRTELEQWWDKCYYSSGQRNAFKPFHQNDFTEEVLAAHDDEVRKVRNYYNDNHELLEAVERRQKLWMEFMEFERKAIDPNRFFNRGCNLLKEEKARKKIMKELPKVEQGVKEHIETWEAANKRQFFVGGRRFVDFIEEQWENFRQQKECEKEQRHQAKAKQTEEEMLYGSRPVSTTPGKRRFAGTPASKTPNKLRRLNETSKTPTSSVSRIMSRTNHSTAISSPIPPPLPPRSHQRPKTPSSRSMQPPSSTRKVLGERVEQQVPSSNHHDIFSHTTVSSNPSHTDSSNASLASVGHYTDFATELTQSSRTNCRSSVLPKQTTPAFF